MHYRFSVLFLFLFLLAACGESPAPDATTDAATDADAGLSVTQEPYGTTGGEAIVQYTLTNENGMAVSVINYGGIITKIMAPDKDGKLADVVPRLRQPGRLHRR